MKKSRMMCRRQVLVKVKGHSRRTKGGKITLVGPHQRVVSSFAPVVSRWESPNKRWKIHKIYGRWMIEDMDTGYGENPVIYVDGRVAFDNPERLPKYVKRQFKWMARIGV